MYKASGCANGKVPMHNIIHEDNTISWEIVKAPNWAAIIIAEVAMKLSSANKMEVQYESK